MQLVALVESPEHVCCRYRLAAFRPFLERAGHSLNFHPWPTSWWARFRLGAELRGAEAVILQRRLVPGWQRTLLRRSLRRLIFDFDDAVFLRDSYAARGIHCERRLRHFAGLVRATDAVVAGNTFLRREAGRYLSPDRVTVIPTCIDPDRYAIAEHTRQGAGVQLIWVGSSSTLKGMETVKPLLEEIGRSVPGLKLKLVCDRFLDLQHVDVIACPWREDREASDIASADIGISWVPDDDWSRGKCGLKVLQYMAAGLPVVANPVGVQVEMVRHGENGFLVETPRQWCEAVRTLARDPELRRRMGEAGRQRVQNDFSVAYGAAKWLALLDSLSSHQRAA
ncbi:MAG: glycosyltransferase family 4 protein [Gemmataceae bacterium]|nr:glycosyltransferase family 4 protein [Gemmataceae bacterium]